MNKVVEKYYSVRDLQLLIGFSERFWRDLALSGELTLREGDEVLAEPVDIGGQMRVPASAINSYLIRHPYRGDPSGIKARNLGELRRKIAAREAEPVGG